jgi:hypothetical protein
MEALGVSIFTEKTRESRVQMPVFMVFSMVGLIYLVVRTDTVVPRVAEFGYDCLQRRYLLGTKRL